ncbi:uncharacterized protein NPIL_84881 [Nephila pilipes]|uniref:Uncharacterized protein n=1 Tax=Nephila pilipes TaxID=299642 RepID=A0A8X6PCI2_NEPPI|nr:uncharacterized protein NPIL_84881 [Nephila pilipes]
MLADKLEALDNIQRSLPSGPRRRVKAGEILSDGNQVISRKPERFPKREHSHVVPNGRSPLKCYGYGRLGVKKSKFPSCNSKSSRRTDETINVNAYRLRLEVLD